MFITNLILLELTDTTIFFYFQFAVTSKIHTKHFSFHPSSKTLLCIYHRNQFRTQLDLNFFLEKMSFILYLNCGAQCFGCKLFIAMNMFFKWLTIICIKRQEFSPQFMSAIYYQKQCQIIKLWNRDFMWSFTLFTQFF